MTQQDRPPPRLLARAGGIHLHAWPGAGPATLIVFAPGRLGAPSDQTWWGRGLAARLGWTTLAFTSERQDWYPSADMAALLPAALAAAGPARVTYGLSMGGYAALKYGQALGARAAIALSPQFSIDPADVAEDDRARHFFDSGRHAGMAVRQQDLPGTAILVFDPMDAQDAAHARRLAALPGLRAVPLRHAGHGTHGVLAEARCLDRVLGAALAGDEAAAVAEIRRSRRSSPTLLAAVAQVLEGRGRARWAEAFAAAAGLGGGSSPGALDARARALHRLGRHREEEVLLREWMAGRPEDLEPRLRLAQCCLAMGEPALAIPAIRDAIAGGAADVRLHAALVDCLRRLDRAEEAIAAAEAAAAAAPGLASVHVQLGGVLVWARRPGPAAAAAFGRALALDTANLAAMAGLVLLDPPCPPGQAPGPRLAALLRHLASSPAAEAGWLLVLDRAQEARRPRVALALAERAAEALPRSVALRQRLGLLRLAAGDAAGAEAAFRAVAEADPGLADAWVGLTDATWRLRRFPEGLAAAAAGAAAHPGHALLAARHATYLVTCGGDAVLAEREARRSIALDPSMESAHLALADALWRQDRGNDALRAVQAAAQALPHSTAIAARLGHLLLAQGSPAEAAVAFEDATRESRPPVHVWMGLSEALWRAGRLAEATEAARRGLAANPDNAELRARLGQLLLAAGDAAAAHDALAEAMAAESASEDVHLAMADALWRQGRRAEAIAAAREALAAAPGRPEVAARLGHLLLEEGAAEEAAALFGQVTRDAPSLVDGWVGLSEAERQRKRIKPALEAYRRAVAEGADRPTVRMMRYRLFGELEE